MNQFKVELKLDEGKPAKLVLTQANANGVSKSEVALSGDRQAVKAQVRKALAEKFGSEIVGTKHDVLKARKEKKG